VIEPKRLFSLIALAAAAACMGSGGNPDLATEFRDSPLRLLPGVQLGMQARDLRRARPEARYSAYLGLQERIPGYRVGYRFASAMRDTQDTVVNDRDDLLAVYMTRDFDATEPALALWNEQVANLTAKKRKPESCEKLPSGQQASWFAGPMALVIGMFPKTAAIPMARVVLVVSPTQSLTQPRGAVPMPCPTS
jgi:hypothetical protein